MKIKNLGNVNTKDNYNSDSLESVISKAYTGNSILFLGAGFSSGCKNEDGKEVPIAKKLSRKICDLGSFERDDDLAYSADYYLKYYDAADLIGLLKGCFYVKDVETYHESIADVDWRRVYTANYDNAFELASGKIGKAIIPLTLDANPTVYFRNRDVCIHINGAIQTLTKNTLESSFKLSESSYTNSDAFSDSSWAYRFKKDIDLCNQIIFVGYSLYDMEIKRLLVSNESIRKKTYFITREDVSTKVHHRLSAFGEVFPIGVKKFGEELKRSKPEQIPLKLKYTSSLKKEEVIFGRAYRDTEIRDFLLRGKSDIGYITYSLTTNTSRYAVERNSVNEALSILKEKNVVVIHGSLANGKSTILDQIIASLLIEGKLVYTVKDKEGDYENDIDSIAELNKETYLVVDDFQSCIDLIRYFSKTLRDNGKLVLSERPHKYRKGISILNDFDLDIYNINADYLHENEAIQLDEIMNSTGLWGNLAGDTKEKRIRSLTKDSESQLSIILMKILKSPHIYKTFKDAFSSILRYPDTKKVVHSICLIQHICPSECNRSFISDISDTTHVYNTEFEERLNESDVFEIRGNRLATRSSIFGTFVLNALYNSSYSIDQLVRIVEKLQRNINSQTPEQNDVYRNIMTFGMIAAILPDEGKPSSYIEFYEKLKTQVPSVTTNPHYWLQYAMAIMSTDNLEDAERILDTAYAKAEKKSNYDTTYIDNQYARLNLKKAITEDEPKLCFNYFSKAHSILKNEKYDIYKFRQAALYIQFYEKKYAFLSIGNKVNFEHAIKLIIKQYEEYLAYEYPSGDIPPYHLESKNEFTKIVDLITNER